MTLYGTCNILKNLWVEDGSHPDGGYWGTQGANDLILMDDDGNSVASVQHPEVHWIGFGSPFPTPPGGPWRAIYIHNHSRFGDCFKIDTKREGDVFLHFATHNSDGCLILPRTPEAVEFMRLLIVHRADLYVTINDPVDNRSDEDKAVPIMHNPPHDKKAPLIPLDYTMITEKLP